jgi:hypothetical protein
MTIRVATVNGTNAETAARNRVLQIRASTKDEFNKNDRFRFSRGVLQGFANRSNELLIPDNIWGDPVVAIGDGFKNIGLTSVSIPGSIASIPSEAFRNNQLTHIIIPGSVTTIGARAFADNHWTTNESKSDGTSYTVHHGLDSVTIPDSVTYVGQDAFASHWTITGYYTDTGRSYTIDHWLVTQVKIGANVNLGFNAIGNGFEKAYAEAGSQAGVYKAKDTYSGKWERFNDVETMRQTQASIEKSQKVGAYILLALTLVIGIVLLATYEPQQTEAKEATL